MSSLTSSIVTSMLADPVGEVGEVRLGAGEEVLVAARVEDDPVLDDEAAIVEPAGVLRVARLAGPDVAGKDAARNASASLPVIRYL